MSIHSPETYFFPVKNIIPFDLKQNMTPLTLCVLCLLHLYVLYLLDYIFYVSYIYMSYVSYIYMFHISCTICSMSLRLYVKCLEDYMFYVSWTICSISLRLFDYGQIQGIERLLSDQRFPFLTRWPPSKQDLLLYRKAGMTSYLCITY